jgi:hypothetical protein
MGSIRHVLWTCVHGEEKHATNQGYFHPYIAVFSAFVCGRSAAELSGAAEGITSAEAPITGVESRGQR